jgi:hypothetical protein
MANTDNPNGFKWIKNLTASDELITVTLATTQTIAKGDALQLSSGQAIIATSGAGQIFAVAAEAETTTTATADILVYPAYPWYEFEGQCSGTYAASIRHSAVDIEGTTGIMEVDENATTEKVFQVTGHNPNSEIGANTRVTGVFIRSSYLDLQDAE